MKVINKEMVKRHKTIDKIQFEIDALKELNHPNIVRYAADFEDAVNIYIVTTKCQTNLYNHFQLKAPLIDEEA